MIKVSMAHVKEMIMDVLLAGLVIFLRSSPGMGKSAISAQLAEANNLLLLDLRLSQMEPTDLLGFPNKFTDKNGNEKAGYLPMNLFPLEGDPLPINPKTGQPYNGWLILLDEFNSASLAVQAAAYKIILDKMVGMYKLHPKVAIICAGNLATDKAIVNRMSTATQSRLIHAELEVCHKTFMAYADKAGIDHRVKSFLNYKPDLLHKFDPNHNDLTFPCPRTWEFLSRIIKPWEDIPLYKLATIAGTVGEGAAREFHSYTQIFQKLPTIKDIIANPVGVPFGNEPSIHYALSGLIGHHINEQNATALVQFVKRLGIDFQVVALRAAIANDRKIRNNQAVCDWVTQNAEELLGN